MTEVRGEAILEALGNESRRRILELLSRKPCYVSEISYSLRMAPKVVLEHLDRLERAGLVSSFEEGRRRYYYIKDSLRLEVVISPHKFAVNVQGGNANSREREFGFDLLDEVWRALKEMEQIRSGKSTLSEIYSALRISEEVHDRFAKFQNIVEARFNEFVERLLTEIESRVNDDFERLIMLAVAKGFRKTSEIAECFKLPYGEVERALNSLMNKGLVKKEYDNGEYVWVIR